MRFPSKAMPTTQDGPVPEVNDETFVAAVLEAGLPVLVDFKAQWCGPCKFMGPIFAQLAPEYASRLKFVKVDVDASPAVANALHIQSIPTFALFNGRKMVATGVGAMPAADLRRWIEAALARVPVPASGSPV